MSPGPNHRERDRRHDAGPGDSRCRMYDTARWRRRRERQLAEEPLCRMCMQLGRVTEATVADHVVPHRGDSDRFYHGALQSLCDSHHSSAKQREEARGYSDALDEDGWPSDPRHPANR